MHQENYDSVLLKKAKLELFFNIKSVIGVSDFRNAVLK